MKEKFGAKWLAVAVFACGGAAPAPAQEDVEVTAVPAEEYAEHPAEIAYLAVGPKEKVVYTADERGGMRAWARADGELLWQEPGKGIPIRGFDVGEDSVVFTFGMAGFSEIVAATGERKSGVGLPRNLTSTCLACDPKDRWVWLGTDAGTLVRLTPGNVNAWSTRVVKNGGTRCLALDPKGNLLAVGGADGTIRFAGGKSANVDDKKVFEGHEGPVTALAFDPKGTKLASGSEDKTVRHWKVSSGKALVVDGHAATVRSVACDPKGRWIASGDEGGVVKLWSTKDGAEVTTLSEGGYGPAVALVFVDRGKTLLAAAGGRLVTEWDVTDL